MSGRDFRERSPSREQRQGTSNTRERSQYRDYELRDDRSRDYRQQFHNAPPRTPYGSRNQGERESASQGIVSRHSRDCSRTTAGSSVEKLLDLPDTIPVPPNGACIDLPLRPSVGTAGRPLEISVNHFEIRTLPIVKVSLL